MRVVVAGGGSAGHIEPALAFADALRRRDPTSEITALGTERGLDTRLIPARGYELALIPPVPIRAGPASTCSRVPGRLRAAVAAAADVLRAPRPTCWSASAATSSGPAYLAARRLRVPDRRARGEPPAGLGQPARRAVHAVRRARPSRARRSRTAGTSGCRSGAAIATLDRAAAGAEARAALRPATPTGRRCW